eukprot:5628441-Prymnesium_polylepis.1
MWPASLRRLATAPSRSPPRPQARAGCGEASSHAACQRGLEWGHLPGGSVRGASIAALDADARDEGQRHGHDDHTKGDDRGDERRRGPVEDVVDVRLATRVAAAEVEDEGEEKVGEGKDHRHVHHVHSHRLARAQQVDQRDDEVDAVGAGREGVCGGNG